MSALESPTISSTRPTSSPSASTTFQPGSIDQPGDRVGLAHTDRPPTEPDRALRRDGMRVGEHVEDLRLARDALVVERARGSARAISGDTP